MPPSISDYRKKIKIVLGAIACLGGTIFPRFIEAWAPDMIPPYPNDIVSFASYFSVFVGMCLFLMGYSWSIQRKRKLAVRFFFCTIILGMAWLSSNAFLVVTTTDEYTGTGGAESEAIYTNRVIRGFGLRERPLEAIANGEVENTPVTLLRVFGENSPKLIWNFVELAELLVWTPFLLFFMGILSTITLLVLQEYGGSTSADTAEPESFATNGSE